MKKILFIILILSSLILPHARGFSMKIDRVILSSDNNPTYLPFWPLAAQAWQKKIGVRPTLALIATKDVEVDETFGDVIRFEPIEGVPNGLYAQVIRILLPCFFEDDVCIISDIDMFPMNKDYFVKSVEKFPDDVFVTFRDQADSYYTSNNIYPMCYNVAKGKVFKEILGLNSLEEIPEIVKKWASYNLGWNTDEIILGRYLNSWSEKDSRFVKLGQRVTRRLDRIYWFYYDWLVEQNWYIDVAPLRPYSQYKDEIDRIAKLMQLTVE